MQWSRLKSLVEGRFAASVGRRVSLHQARYRYTAEEVGRVWIAVDGRDVASFATGVSWSATRAGAERLMDEREAWGSPAAYNQACDEAAAAVRRAGVYDDADALAELEASLSSRRPGGGGGSAATVATRPRLSYSVGQTHALYSPVTPPRV